MSATLSRRILFSLCKNHLRKFPIRTRVIKFSSTAKYNKPNLDSKNDPTSEQISAAVLKDFGSPLVLDCFEPLKISQQNEVVVDVQYCTLSASDVMLAKNSYTFQPNLPIILGQEFVGKLVQVGEVATKNGFKVGDKVIALNKNCFGGLSEQCIADVEDIWKLSSEIRGIDAVSLMDDYISALLALESKVTLQEDDLIIINVGMSSMSLAAVDLATNVYRAQVIGVCATEEGAHLARDKGTVLASLKYKSGKVYKQLEELAALKNITEIFADAEGEHLKKIIDCFTSIYRSGATITDLLRDDGFAVVVHHLSREGRLIIAGSTAIMTETDTDRFSVAGFNLREYKEKKPMEFRQAGEDVLQFFEEGLIKPAYVMTVGLCNVNEAMEFISKSKSPGKVVVDIRNKEAKAELVGKE